MDRDASRRRQLAGRTNRQAAGRNVSTAGSRPAVLPVQAENDRRGDRFSLRPIDQYPPAYRAPDLASTIAATFAATTRILGDGPSSLVFVGPWSVLAPVPEILRRRMEISRDRSGPSLEPESFMDSASGFAPALLVPTDTTPTSAAKSLARFQVEMRNWRSDVSWLFPEGRCEPDWGWHRSPRRLPIRRSLWSSGFSISHRHPAKRFLRNGLCCARCHLASGSACPNARGFRDCHGLAFALVGLCPVAVDGFARLGRARAPHVGRTRRRGCFGRLAPRQRGARHHCEGCNTSKPKFGLSCSPY